MAPIFLTLFLLFCDLFCHATLLFQNLAHFPAKSDPILFFLVNLESEKIFVIIHVFDLLAGFFGFGLQFALIVCMLDFNDDA